MANEITYSGRLSVTKGSLSLTKQLATQRASMAGDAYSAGVQSIPTTAAGTAVTLSAAMTTAGFGTFTNLDATNFLEVGIQHSGTTFVGFIKLLAGETSPPVRLATTTIFARADTGACLLEHTILEA